MGRRSLPKTPGISLPLQRLPPVSQSQCPPGMGAFLDRRIGIRFQEHRMVHRGSSFPFSRWAENHRRCYERNQGSLGDISSEGKISPHLRIGWQHRCSQDFRWLYQRWSMQEVRGLYITRELGEWDSHLGCVVRFLEPSMQSVIFEERDRGYKQDFF